VLQYHSTPWMNEQWRLDDLRYFGTKQDVVENALQSLHLSAYFPGGEDAITPDNNIQTTIPNLNEQTRTYGITNLTLFSLGIALLELNHWKSIYTGNDILAARELVDRGSPLGPKYRDLVKKCLQCNFGFGTDLSKPELQNAVYNDVVCQLEEMISVLDIGVD